MSEPPFLLYVHHPLTAEQREQRMHTLATCEATIGIDMSRVRRWHIPAKSSAAIGITTTA